MLGLIIAAVLLVAFGAVLLASGQLIYSGDLRFERENKIAGAYVAGYRHEEGSSWTSLMVRIPYLDSEKLYQVSHARIKKSDYPIDKYVFVRFRTNGAWADVRLIGKDAPLSGTVVGRYISMAGIGMFCAAVVLASIWVVMKLTA